MQSEVCKLLEEIAIMDRGGVKEPINGDSSALYQNAKYEGKKFLGTEIPASLGAGWYYQLKEAQEKAKAALALLRRNCDVGTADEQAERFIDYCCSKCDGSNCKHGVYREDELYKCAIKWAQLPYAEEGDNDGR